jgi:hypothetical protein
VTLRGWQPTDVDGTRSYGGSYYDAVLRAPAADTYLPWRVSLWPRLGEVGSSDPTKPLIPGHGYFEFSSEGDARFYVESWERASKEAT